MDLREMRLFIQSCIYAIYSKDERNDEAIEQLQDRLIKKVDQVFDKVKFVPQ